MGSGGGGGDRLSSEKLAEVGRGDGWGESARQTLAWEDEIDVSESVQGQGPTRSGDTTLIPCVKRMPSALPSPPS